LFGSPAHRDARAGLNVRPIAFEPTALEHALLKTQNLLSRRAFARSLGWGAAALVTARFTQSASAQANAQWGNQAEWVQKYEADERLAVPRATTPLLSQATLAQTEQAIALYRDLASRGGWGTVPGGASMKVGSRGNNVVALRRRLIASGDLDASTGQSPVFDSYVEAGVKRFQGRHGIGTTGVVAQQTLQALNVSTADRLRQLETNLVRLRSFSGNLGARHVIMNIPGAEVQTVEGGVIQTHHAAGVGKIDRQSPVMQAKALEINFNPFWTVPASIIRKDLIPKMQADPNYLTENKIRVINSSGQEIPPNAINWNSMEATNYRFRQDPGGDFNSLGFVRINIANPYGVYMHDTPAKGIFGDDFRFVSSGCVRVQNVRDYVAWLLKDNPGWDRNRIDEAIRSGQQISVKLTPAVPVYWVYITAWANEGIVQFREDIYKRDGFGGAVAAAASAKGAPKPLNGQVISDEDFEE
jgi:murein L,D-transpeptidase YcbB/YkuD